jgi:hypothetical protein
VIKENGLVMERSNYNRMQSDFGELRSPQPLMRSVMSTIQHSENFQ